MTQTLQERLAQMVEDTGMTLDEMFAHRRAELLARGAGLAPCLVPAAIVNLARQFS